MEGVRPADGAGDLVGERPADLRRCAGEIRRDVGDDRDLWRLGGDLVEDGGHLLAKRGHQAAVERGAHIQRQNAARAALFGQRGGPLHGWQFAGDDALLRGVIVGYLNDPRLYTISVALRTYADPAGVTNWGAIFAMATLALLPVFAVFIFFQRYLVEGISTAGLSGR